MYINKELVARGTGEWLGTLWLSSWSWVWQEIMRGVDASIVLGSSNRQKPCKSTKLSEEVNRGTSIHFPTNFARAEEGKLPGDARPKATEVVSVVHHAIDKGPDEHSANVYTFYIRWQVRKWQRIDSHQIKCTSHTSKYNEAATRQIQQLDFPTAVREFKTCFEQYIHRGWALIV